MKRFFTHTRSVILCAVMITAILVSACGGSGGSADAENKVEDVGTAAESPQEEAAGGADGEGENDRSASTASGSSDAIGSLVYEKNDLAIRIADISQEQGYYFLDLEIVNNADQEVSLELYPLVINDTVSVSEGIFQTIASGETFLGETAIRTNLLGFAGIPSIETIDGYIQLKDTENYGPITEKERITILAGDGGDTGSGISHSDRILYDTDGICLSYLGTFKDDYSGNTAVFFVTNDSENTVGIGNPWEEERIDGAAASDRYMAFEGATIMPGDSALVSACVLNSTTYEAADFSSLDGEIEISMDNENWIPEQVPFHLKKEGESIAFSADEPYITEEGQELLAMRQEAAAEEQAQAEHDQALSENAEEAVGPEITKTGIYNYVVGMKKSSALITALVHNPNERTALYHVDLSCSAFDADGNLLDEPKLYYYQDYLILPGEDLPFVMNVNSLAADARVDHVDITVNAYDSVNTVDMMSTASTYGLEIPAEKIRFENPVVSEGGADDDAFTGRRAANLTGTLVNDGDPANMVRIVYSLYDQDDQIILAGHKLESELETGEIPDYYTEFGPAIYELPGYDHVEVRCFEKAARQ